MRKKKFKLIKKIKLLENIDDKYKSYISDEIDYIICNTELGKILITHGYKSKEKMKEKLDSIHEDYDVILCCYPKSVSSDKHIILKDYDNKLYTTINKTNKITVSIKLLDRCKIEDFDLVLSINILNCDINEYRNYCGRIRDYVVFDSDIGRILLYRRQLNKTVSLNRLNEINNIELFDYVLIGYPGRFSDKYNVLLKELNDDIYTRVISEGDKSILEVSILKDERWT